MLELDNKKILIIMPNFFEYDKLIKKALINRGATVNIVYDNLARSSVFDFIMRFKICQLIYSLFVKCFLKKILHIDYLLVIKGQNTSLSLMKKLRDKYKNAKFIMYQWDSAKNCPNSIKIEHFFDSIFTFDKNDSEKYNWIYRPLFYSFNSKLVKNSNRKYKFSFLGSLHSNRAFIVKKLKEITKEQEFCSFTFLYVNRILYYWQKYIKKSSIWKNIDISNIYFKPLNLSQTNYIYKNSDIVIDYTHPNQTGLTMRTIEALGAKCKLMTNNKAIIQSDLYNENNVWVYDLNNFCIPKNFINSQYVEYTEKIYNYYSLDGWIDTIFKD